MPDKLSYKLFCWARTPQIIPLYVLGRKLADFCEFVLIFHALYADFQVQLMNHFAKQEQKLVFITTAHRPRGKSSINLYHIRTQFRQIAEIGIPTAKIIQGQ